MNNLMSLFLLSTATATTAHQKKRAASYKYACNQRGLLRSDSSETTSQALPLSNPTESKVPTINSNELAMLNSLYLADDATGIPSSSGPFSLPPLEYNYNALEPYIDEATMRLHHDAHHRTYVNNLNTVLSRYPEFYDYTLEELLLFSDRLPSDIQTQVLNNAGGHYNHSLTWKLIGPPTNAMPTGELKTAIETQFGTFDNLKGALKAAALSVFGSGYAWLILNPYGRLQIVTTSNQNTPIALRGIPILPIDVWEHAYYLKNQNRRGEYVDNYFKVINWNRVGDRYDAALASLNLPANTPQ